MPYLNALDFMKVHAVLAAASAESPDFDDALKVMDDAAARRATPEEVAAAADLYASDTVEIDDEGAGASRGDDGCWVQAWVWVPERGLEDDDDDLFA